MSKWGLAIHLTNNSGRKWDEDEAQEQIDLFYGDTAFWRLGEFQQELIEDYETNKYIKLPCGWYMWGDNENFRSVANVPIQGFGASVMRKAVDLAEARGVKVLFTLHDAIYMEDKIGNEHKIAVLRDCMREAFVFYFPEELKPYARKIKLDPFAWSPEYKRDSQIFVGKHKWRVPTSDLYIDDRALDDYTRFSRYFDDRAEDNL